MIAKLLKWTVVTYMTLTFLVALPAYNWMYITNHSYPRWISAGLYRASARALAWPVFIRDLQIGPVAHLKRSLFLIVDADALTRGWDLRQRPSPEDWPKVVGKLREALVEARRIDADSLDNLYPGLGTHLDMEYRPGLERITQNPELHLDADMITGMHLMRLWSSWSYENRDALTQAL